MVIVRLYLYLQLVLYSSIGGWWKIADFGIISPGTTSRSLTTTSARGKEGYRAPELFHHFKSTYTNKVDVWSLGCILYELSTEQKAFRDDMDTYRFAQGESNLEISFAPWLIHHPAISVLKAWILQALLPEPEARPSARDL